MHGHRRWARALTILVMAVVFVPSSRARAATTAVIERGSQYVPAQVDVAVGDSVTWIYESSSDPRGHTVTFNDKDLNPNCPGFLGLNNDCQNSSSQRVSRTFTSAGTYAYRCRIVSGMTGVVVVTGAGGSTSSTAGPGSSTTATGKSSTTTTRAATSSTTAATTRALATSSTVIKSTTTTSDPSSALQPGEAPPLSGDNSNSNAAGKSGSSTGGNDTSTVALIVGALLAASAGGGYLLWRLRPGRV
jgi:plastocyanin